MTINQLPLTHLAEFTKATNFPMPEMTDKIIPAMIEIIQKKEIQHEEIFSEILEKLDITANRFKTLCDICEGDMSSIEGDFKPPIEQLDLASFISGDNFTPIKNTFDILPLIAEQLYITIHGPLDNQCRRLEEKLNFLKKEIYRFLELMQQLLEYDRVVGELRNAFNDLYNNLILFLSNKSTIGVMIMLLAAIDKFFNLFELEFLPKFGKADAERRRLAEEREEKEKTPRVAEKPIGENFSNGKRCENQLKLDLCAAMLGVSVRQLQRYEKDPDWLVKTGYPGRFVTREVYDAWSRPFRENRQLNKAARARALARAEEHGCQMRLKKRVQLP